MSYAVKFQDLFPHRGRCGEWLGLCSYKTPWLYCLSGVLIFVFCCVAVMLLLPAVAVQGDEVLQTDGTKLSGRILSFDGRNLTVQSASGQVRSIPMVDVASFVVDPSAELIRRIDKVQQDLDQIGRMVDNLGASWQEGRDQIRADVTDLNPMTQVVISKKSGFFRKSTFVIEGEVRNRSSVFIRDVHIRATFYNREGVPVNEVVFPTLVSTISPGSGAKFQKDIPNAPRFETFELTLLEGRPQTTERRGGAQKR